MPPMLKVKNLKVSFSKKNKIFFPVRDVTFEIQEGESIGIVGESGCGKTTVALAIQGLLRGATIEGQIIKSSEDSFGMVFQSPMTSLNPTMKIEHQVTEGMIYHGLYTKKEAKKRALELLDLVQIDNPELRLKQYPHELSGGQRQRVCIAIALSCNPKVLIADEPTTALDITVQVQIIQLLQDLKKKLKMSLILISHDLGVVRKLCDRTLVFYGGKIAEQGNTQEILEKPKHPYTQMLIQCIPSITLPRIKQLRVIKGSPPEASDIEPGCPFYKRCPYKTEVCREEPPFFGSAACWRRS